MARKERLLSEQGATSRGANSAMRRGAGAGELHSVAKIHSSERLRAPWRIRSSLVALTVTASIVLAALVLGVWLASFPDPDAGEPVVTVAVTPPPPKPAAAPPAAPAPGPEIDLPPGFSIVGPPSAREQPPGALAVQPQSAPGQPPAPQQQAAAPPAPQVQAAPP
jgi:hypothetical protein